MEFDYPYCDDVDQKYERSMRIGKGTFGEVFRARNRNKRSEEVALKKILMDNEKEGFPITAIREIKLLSAIGERRSENVVRLIEVCRSSEGSGGNAISYLVFEFCHHDLAGLIQESHDKIKSLPIIKCIVKQLLTGLFSLHINQILHRDMKSSNILITKNGVLKIADFGLARPFIASDRTKKYTNRVVTLWYRPPELLLGERCYGPAVDLWGVGCIMCELFTREPMMKGSTEQHQLQLITENVGPITTDVWPAVKELPMYNKLSNTISKPTKKILFNKLRRYTTYDKALDLIRKLLTLDPEQRIDTEAALDDDFFYDDQHPTATQQQLAENLSAISQSQFEYTTRKRNTTATHSNNHIAQPMVNRSNTYRPIGHRPGPSNNNDGQYRDHIY